MFDPTMGTLIVGADLDAKICKAIRRAAYCIAFRMYLRLPGIYFRLLAVKCREARLHIHRFFYSCLMQFVVYTHRIIPRWSEY